MTSTDQDSDKHYGKATRQLFSLKSRIAGATLAILLLVGGFGGWAASAQLTSAVIAQGTLVVAQNVKKIQHREGGIVRKINVANGDKVAAGDVLVVLDDTQVKAALGVLKSQIAELSGRQARLMAERDGKVMINFPKSLLNNDSNRFRDILKGEQRVFNDNKAIRESQKEQLEARISQFRREIEGLQTQRKAKLREIKPVKSELKQMRVLVRRKLATIARKNALEREFEKINGAIGGLDAQIARAEGQISEVKLQILAIERKARSDAQKELRVIEAKLKELEERRRAAQSRLKHMVLKAPLDGTVHQLKVHTVGGVISPAEPLMLIVPEHDSLKLEVRFSPVDIDQVRVGMPARIRFSAFNQRTTPEVPGRISYVSPDVSRDSRTGQSFYLGHVTMDEKGMNLIGGARKLLPGMPVEVYITTQKRTAFTYFVKPFTDQLSRAFREE